jgi:hypothetical protein
MRSTIHLVSGRDYWPFAEATRDARRCSSGRICVHRPKVFHEAEAARLADFVAD